MGTINVDGNYLASNGGGDLNGGGEIFVAKLDTAGNYVWAVSGGSSDSDQPFPARRVRWCTSHNCLRTRFSVYTRSIRNNSREVA